MTKINTATSTLSPSNATYTNIVRTCIEAVAAISERRRNRIVLKDLALRDDYLLDDIGLSRRDIENALLHGSSAGSIRQLKLSIQLQHRRPDQG